MTDVITLLNVCAVSLTPSKSYIKRFNPSSSRALRKAKRVYKMSLLERPVNRA